MGCGSHVFKRKLPLVVTVIAETAMAPKDRAAQPTSARTRKRSDQEAPASKKARTGDASELLCDAIADTAALAYITFDADAQALDTNLDYRAVMQEVTHCIEAGAKIINLAFKRTVASDVVNVDSILIGLKEIFDERWTSSV